MADRQKPDMRVQNGKWVGWKEHPWTEEQVAAFGRWFDTAVANLDAGFRVLPPPPSLTRQASPAGTVPAPLPLLLALKAQIERDAVELESTTRWCRTLPQLIDQGGMPKAWDQLVSLLKELGHEV